MPRIKLLVLLLLAALLIAQSASGGDWGLHVKAGAAATWWFTRDDDDDEEHTGHAIDYETEPARSWTAEAIVRYGDRERYSLNELFGLSVTHPFGTAPDQSEVIEKTNSAVTSLQNFLAFLQGLSILGPESEGFVRFIAGLRLDYRRAIFHGKGIAVEPAVFASRDSGLIPLDVGDEFQMRAEFEDWYLTIVRFQPDKRDLRLGVYRLVLEKPHETMEWGEGGGGALVVETRLTGAGIFFQGVTRSWDFLVRLGSVDFEALGDLGDQRAYGGSGSFSMLMEFGWNPSIVLAGPPSDGSYSLPRLAVQPVVGFQFRGE